MANRTVAVDLIARVQGYIGRLKTAVVATKEFSGELDQMRKKNSAGYQDITSSLLKVGAALTFISGWAIKTALEFDKAMSEVKAITGATAAEMGRLRQAALDAGSSTVFSATQVAGAEAELAKAGLTTSQILGGALAGTLSLAAAGTIDLGDAATVAANTMNQFALQGKDVSHIADLLAGAANATTADVHDLALALQMGGGAAHAAGLSLEDTLTALGALAKAALNGSDAGTSLKTMLLQLEGPSVKAAGIMAEYGFSIYDASGNMVDLYEIADRLRKSFGGLTQQQRNAAFATIFGNDAVRSANALYVQGSAGLRQINKDLNAQADAAGVAATKTDNLAGDLNHLKGKLDSLLIGSSTGANSGLRIILQALDHLVGTFERLPGPVQSGIVVLAGVSGAALLAAAAFLKLRKASADTFEAMASAGPITARLGSGLQRVTAFAGRAAAALLALQLAGTLVNSLFHDDLNTNVDSLSQALADFGRTGQITGEATKVLGANMDDLGRTLNGVANDGFAHATDAASDWVLGIVGMDSPLDDAKVKAAALDQALTSMVQTGHADDAAAAFQRIWETAQQSGIGLDKLQAAFPGYIAAAAAAANASGTTATAINGVGAAAGSEAALAEAARQRNIKLAGAFGAAASAAGGLKDAFDRLNGGFIDWETAEANVEESLANLKQSLKDNGRTFDAHTEKGRANIRALADFAKATRDAMQAKIDETGNVKDANAIYEKYRAQLVKAAMQAGYARAAAEKLADQWLQMPSSVTTTVNIQVHVSNAQDWSDLRRMEREGDKTINRTVNVTERTTSHQQRRYGGITHAAVGSLRDAAVYGGRGGTLYAFAEPETGGEAFVPRRGDRTRSLGILSAAAAWYGATVVARPFHGTAPAPRLDAALAAVADMKRGGPSPADFARAVRAGLQGAVVVLNGREVGRVQGLQADTLGRGF